MKKHTPRLHPGQGTRTGVGGRGWVVKAGLYHYKFSIHVHFFFILSFKVLWFCVTIVTFSNTSCIYVSIYLLWLHWVFVAGHRLSLVLMHGLLTAVASIVSGLARPIGCFWASLVTVKLHRL